MRKPRRLNGEERLHAAVADFLRVALVPPAFFTTFPAGGGGKVRGGRLKLLGLRPGMPDILVVGWGCLVGIELKTANGIVSASQNLVHGEFRDCGHPIFVCRSIDEVETALRQSGIKLKGRITR